MRQSVSLETGPAHLEMGSPQDATAISGRARLKTDHPISRRPRLETGPRVSQVSRRTGRLKTAAVPSQDAAVLRRPTHLETRPSRDGPVSRWTRAHLETPAVLRWARPRLETYSFRDDHPVLRRAVSRWATPSWDGGVRFPKMRYCTVQLHAYSTAAAGRLALRNVKNLDS